MTVIWYASFPAPTPVGGVRVLSQQVDLLRGVGFDARLWLPPGAQRPAWFDDDVPAHTAETVRLGAEDLLVLPEVPLPPGGDPAPGGRTVIFNQNHYYTFAAGDWGSEPYPGWVRRPAAIWVVSQESRAIMQRLCPGLDVRHIPTTIDADLFRPGPERVPGIAWIPRKRPREASLLARLLGGDSRTVDLELHEIVDRPLAEVADILGRITAFVSLGHNEGLGLTPAEALAAGCRVVGYDGGGGRELFEAPGAEAVAEARPLQLADRAVELATGSYDATLGRASRAWIAARYSPQRTTTALRDAVAAALTAPGKACVATHPARWFATIAPDFAVSG